MSECKHKFIYKTDILAMSYEFCAVVEKCSTCKDYNRIEIEDGNLESFFDSRPDIVKDLYEYIKRKNRE